MYALTKGIMAGTLTETALPMNNHRSTRHNRCNNRFVVLSVVLNSFALSRGKERVAFIIKQDMRPQLRQWVLQQYKRYQEKHKAYEEMDKSDSDQERPARRFNSAMFDNHLLIQDKGKHCIGNKCYDDEYLNNHHHCCCSVGE